jgi:hypothetical protein
MELGGSCLGSLVEPRFTLVQRTLDPSELLVLYTGEELPIPRATGKAFETLVENLVSAPGCIMDRIQRLQSELSSLSSLPRTEDDRTIIVLHSPGRTDVKTSEIHHG